MAMWKSAPPMEWYWPSLRGLMTWSINWDRFGGGEFQRTFDGYFG
ncbi:hypothetical protein [Streptomyces sp. McG7]